MIDRLAQRNAGSTLIQENPLKDDTQPKDKAEPKPQAKQEQKSDLGGSVFECNICLENANEPVVTPCGHLYCWKCIYEWLQQPRDTLVCPVCKSGITKEKLIPIFTKENSNDPRKADNIPNRPGGQRSAPEPNQNMRNQGGIFGNGLGGNGGGFVMGLGLFPPLFTLNFTWDDIYG